MLRGGSKKGSMTLRFVADTSSGINEAATVIGERVFASPFFPHLLSLSLASTFKAAV